MVRVAIIGASGYTGAESIEILLRHNGAKLTYLSALPEECGLISDIFGRFKGLRNGGYAAGFGKAGGRGGRFVVLPA